MKKTTFYKIGALSLSLLGAGIFTSFDNAMTDEQKIEAAYNQMVTDYKAEQTELCKRQALEMAQAEWAKMQSEMIIDGDMEEPPTSYQGNSRPSRSYSSSSSNNNGSSEQPTTTAPTTTTGGNTVTTKPKDQKMNMSNDSKSGGKMDMSNNNDGSKSGGKMNMRNDSKSGGKMDMKK